MMFPTTKLGWFWYYHGNAIVFWGSMTFIVLLLIGLCITSQERKP